MTSLTSTPPAQDTEAERAVIGSLLLFPPSFHEVRGLDLRADDFYVPRHAELYAELLAANAKGIPVEPIAFAGWLLDRGLLRAGTARGGAEYLHSCMIGAAVTGSISYYVKRLQECADRRKAVAAGLRIIAEAEQGRDASAVVSMGETMLADVGRRTGGDGALRLGDLLDAHLASLDVPRTPAVPTGFVDWDRWTGGLMPGQLSTFFAPTGGGKSLALSTIAANVAMRAGRPAVLFNLEMSQAEVLNRIIAATCRVPQVALRDGTLTDTHWSKIIDKIEALKSAPLWVWAQGTISTGDVRAILARKRKELAVTPIAFVDHVQLVTPPRRLSGNRPEEIGQIAAALRGTAQDLDTTVVLAAQTNGDRDGRADKTPMLTDIYGSRQVGHESSSVTGIRVIEFDDPASPRIGEADWHILKNRHGAAGVTVPVAAQLHHSLFVSLHKP